MTSCSRRWKTSLKSGADEVWNIFNMVLVKSSGTHDLVWVDTLSKSQNCENPLQKSCWPHGTAWDWSLFWFTGCSRPRRKNVRSGSSSNARLIVFTRPLRSYWSYDLLRLDLLYLDNDKILLCRLYYCHWLFMGKSKSSGKLTVFGLWASGLQSVMSGKCRYGIRTTVKSWTYVTYDAGMLKTGESMKKYSTVLEQFCLKTVFATPTSRQKATVFIIHLKSQSYANKTATGVNDDGGEWDYGHQDVHLRALLGALFSSLSYQRDSLSQPTIVQYCFLCWPKLWTITQN